MPVSDFSSRAAAPRLSTSHDQCSRTPSYPRTPYIRNNNAADRLTASWFAIEKQENGRNVRDPELCSGFSLLGRRVVELLIMSWLRLWIMGAVKPVGQLHGSPTALTSQYLAWGRYCTYVVQTPRVGRGIFLEQIRPTVAPEPRGTNR